MKALLRRAFRAVSSAIVRFHSRPFQPASSGGAVVIAPHPDDEAFGCAGLIATLRGSGRPVAIVYLTDGAASHPGHPLLTGEILARRRRTEAETAMARVGLAPERLHFLDLPDGALDRLGPAELDAATARLAARLAQIPSTEIYLPCADDGSTEHAAAFRLTRAALARGGLDPRLLEFPIWARWRPQALLALAVRRRRVWRLALADPAGKRAVIAAYASQTEASPPWTTPVLPAGFAACFSNAEEFFFEA